MKIILSLTSYLINFCRETNYKKTYPRRPPIKKKDETHPALSFFNPGLSLKSYTLINGIWQTHVLNQKKEFRRAMTTLAEYILEEEKTLNLIKEKVKSIGEKSIEITPDLITLYDLYGLIENQQWLS